MSIQVDALRSLIPISQFNKGQANRIFSRAKSEGKLVVLKNNAPEAVILSPGEFQRMCEIEEDYRLLLIAQERLAAENGQNAIGEKDVLSDLGITEESLSAAADVEIE